MTADLQAERDATPPGNSRQLRSKEVSFGILTHNVDGTWNTSQVQGLAFDALPPDVQNDLIEFLKSLQVLPPGSKSLVVDEHGNPKDWPPSAESSEDER